MQADRLTRLRGTTPILEDAAIHAMGSRPRTSYGRHQAKSDSAEYAALIERGATHAMINQFQLEFTDEEGIGI